MNISPKILHSIVARLNAHKTRHEKDGADEMCVVLGDIDGGDIGGPTEAMDSAQCDLDGGVI